MDQSSNDKLVYENGNDSTQGLTEKMLSSEQVQVPLPPASFNFIRIIFLCLKVYLIMVNLI